MINNNIRLAYWDDIEEDAHRLGKMCGKLGFSDQTAVRIQALDYSSIASEIVEANVDIALLDIVTEDDNQLGVKAARHIRELEPLLPMIAVTSHPDKVFGGASGELFSGMYHKEYLKAADSSTLQIQIRDTLGKWGASHPDYVLIRSIKRMALTRGNDASDKVSKLIKALYRLTITDSIESWLGKCVDLVAEHVQGTGLQTLAPGFLSTASLFKDADSFYMAGSRSRKHASHVVRVFLLGLGVLMSGCPIGREAGKLRGAKLDENELDVAIAKWGCFAFTHDVGYLLERWTSVRKELTSALTRLAGDVATDWVTSPKGFAFERHNVIGRDKWRSIGGQHSSNEIHVSASDEIGEAVFLHDPKLVEADVGGTPAHYPVNDGKWLSFLAIIADELQDWGREREETTKKWRQVCIEHFEVVRDGSEANDWCLSIDLAFYAHCRSAASRIATAGGDSVVERFKESKQLLEGKLRCSFGFTILLRAVIIEPLLGDDVDGVDISFRKPD